MNLLKNGVRWEGRPNILLPPLLKTLNEKNRAELMRFLIYAQDASDETTLHLYFLEDNEKNWAKGNKNRHT